MTRPRWMNTLFSGSDNNSEKRDSDLVAYCDALERRIAAHETPASEGPTEEEVKDLAVALHAAAAQCTFAKSKAYLAKDAQLSVLYASMAREAFEHIPYLKKLRS